MIHGLLQRMLWTSAALCLLLPGCKREAETTPPERSAPTGSTTNFAEAAYGEPSDAPAPRAVCLRMFEIAMAEAGVSESELDEAVLDECAAELEAEAQFRGPRSWKGIATCVVEAETGADIQMCDQAFPLEGGAQPGGAPPGAQPTYDLASVESQACVHMLEIIVTEAEAAGEMLPEVSEDELRSLHEECMDMLFQVEKPARTPDEYEVFVGCILYGKTSAEIQACQ